MLVFGPARGGGSRTDLLLFGCEKYKKYRRGRTDRGHGDPGGEAVAVTKETVYIKADQSVEVTKREVTLGDIMKIECASADMIPKIKALKILKVPDEGRHRYVVSVLKIIECIHQHYPSLDIRNMGEKDIIITYEDQKTPGAFVHALKVIAVVATTFTGSAFSIMAFNNDVDTTKMFGQIYELLMGQPSDGFTVLELTYCAGLIIGILVFFNHFGGKRFTVDPTPMEVEMRLYENDIQTTLIETYSRKEQELDVGKRAVTGSHRT